MMLKKYLKLFRILLLVIVSITEIYLAKNISHGNDSLSDHIDHIYKYLQNQDFEALNEKYIHPKYGVVIIYRLGVYDSVKKNIKIDKKTLKEFLPFFYPQKINLPSKQKLWRKVSYSCEKEEWSNGGYFLQKVEKTDILSNIIKIKKEHFNTESNIPFITFIEHGLYHYTDTINGLDLYLKYIAGHWYIVIWDTTIGDCDA